MRKDEVKGRKRNAIQTSTCQIDRSESVTHHGRVCKTLNGEMTKEHNKQQRASHSALCEFRRRNNACVLPPVLLLQSRLFVCSSFIFTGARLPLTSTLMWQSTLAASCTHTAACAYREKENYEKWNAIKLANILIDDVCRSVDGATHLSNGKSHSSRRLNSKLIWHHEMRYTAFSARRRPHEISN